MAHVIVNNMLNIIIAFRVQQSTRFGPFGTSRLKNGVEIPKNVCSESLTIGAFFGLERGERERKGERREKRKEREEEEWREDEI